jgi:hypothetical protein
MNEQEKMRHDLANSLLEASENLTPFIDHADGMRADLERRGWSPTAAEAVALEVLLGFVRLAVGGVPK